MSEAAVQERLGWERAGGFVLVALGVSELRAKQGGRRKNEGRRL